MLVSCFPLPHLLTQTHAHKLSLLYKAELHSTLSYHQVENWKPLLAPRGCSKLTLLFLLVHWVRWKLMPVVYRH